MSDYVIFCNLFNWTMLAGLIASCVVCVLLDRIEFWWKRKRDEKSRRKSPRDEFGWIEIEPDVTGRGELRTKIHWSK